MLHCAECGALVGTKFSSSATVNEMVTEPACMPRSSVRAVAARPAAVLAK